MKLRPIHEVLLVLLSLFIQVPLALFLGHYYDTRVYMATGYLVSSGLDPYLQHNFVNVFPSSVLSGTVPIIGYPPPWALFLGLGYKLSFAITQNVFLYNFAIKIPIIAANLCLAYLIRKILLNSQVSLEKAQIAFLIVLFNPFILLTTVAWGAFDIVVAVLCLAAFYFLSRGRVVECALCLGFGVALKPIALPLAPLPIFFSQSMVTFKKKLLYVALFSVTLVTCYVGPFLIAGWRIPLAQNEWNSQVQMAGGMTLFNVVEIFQPQTILPQELAFLGYLWVPALLIAYYQVYRDRPTNLKGLIKKIIPVFLIFLLSRTWVSEPNINVILPFILLAAALSEVRFKDFHIAWLIPLIFMFPNYAFPQLFFLVNPSIMTSLQLFNSQFGTARLLARFLVAAAWQVFALKKVVEILRSR